jgi:hypothetical protein
MGMSHPPPADLELAQREGQRFVSVKVGCGQRWEDLGEPAGLVEACLIAHAAIGVYDHATDSSDTRIELHESLRVHLYQEVVDADGNAQYRLASGIVVPHVALDWNPHIRWCCRIDASSELARPKPPMPNSAEIKLANDE